MRRLLVILAELLLIFIIINLVTDGYLSSFFPSNNLIEEKYLKKISKSMRTDVSKVTDIFKPAKKPPKHNKSLPDVKTLLSRFDPLFSNSSHVVNDIASGNFKGNEKNLKKIEDSLKEIGINLDMSKRYMY